MSNFRGYYIRIGDCKFLDPALKREGFKLYPKIEQVTDAGAVASGKIIMKVLPHKPAKIEATFPIMTPTQYQKYFDVISQSMYLEVEYYDDSIDAYVIKTCYHTDIVGTPVIYGGRRMILMDTIKFVEH